MRIAICLFGQLRTGLRAFSNIKHFIGDLWSDCDFFIHTWNTEEHRDILHFLETKKRPISIVDPKNLDTYMDLYNPKESVVQDQAQYDLWLRNTYGPTGNLVHLYHSFFESTILKRDYENKNGFKYDIVIRLRPDIVYPKDRSLISDINEYLKNPNAIYSCRKDDFYHISSSINADTSGNFYNDTNMFFGRTDVWPLNAYLAYLDKNNIEFKDLNDYRASPLRPEAVIFDPIENYHQICIINSHLYDSITFSTRHIWTVYINRNSVNWVNDMYLEFDRIFGKDVTIELEKTMEQKRNQSPIVI